MDLEPWHDLFVMTGGAVAALAGLIFVAVSLNLERILEHPSIPGVAARTVMILVGLLVMTVFLLVPGASALLVGVELLVLGVAIALAVMIGTAVSIRRLEQRSWRLTNLVRSGVAVLPMPIAGILFLVGSPTALGWVVAAIVAGVVIAVYQAWILLVEIRR